MVVYNGLGGSDVLSPLKRDSITADPNFRIFDSLELDNYNSRTVFHHFDSVLLDRHTHKRTTKGVFLKLRL